MFLGREEFIYFASFLIKLRRRELYYISPPTLLLVMLVCLMIPRPRATRSREVVELVLRTND